MRARRPLRHAGRWSLAASLGLHSLVAVAALALHAAPPPGPVREGREYRLELAREELHAPPAEQPEPMPEPPELPAELSPPELVPQEVAQREPPPADPPPQLDDRFVLVDPLRRVTETAWPDRAPPPTPAPTPVAREVVPPPPAPAPAEAPRVHVPVVLEDPAPRYPRAAQRLGLEGSVQLRARVARDGRVHSVEVVSSSGHAILDEAAREKLYEWLFRPWQPGEPEERNFLKTFTFRMPR